MCSRLNSRAQCSGGTGILPPNLVALLFDKERHDPKDLHLIENRFRINPRAVDIGVRVEYRPGLKALSLVL